MWKLRVLVLFLVRIFSRIRTEYGEIGSISSYSVQMWENTDQKNYVYGYISCSDGLRNCWGIGAVEELVLPFEILLLEELFYESLMNKNGLDSLKFLEAISTKKKSIFTLRVFLLLLANMSKSTVIRIFFYIYYRNYEWEISFCL